MDHNKYPSERKLAFFGILLLGLNLRIAILAVSPLFKKIEVDVSLSSTMKGVLGSLPEVIFALFGLFVPKLIRRFGPEVTVISASLVLGLGQLFRSWTHHDSTFIGSSILAFVGIATCNITLPPLVKKYFPDKISLVTSLYLTLMALGMTAASSASLPLANLWGWRGALAFWSLFAFVTIIPWAIVEWEEKRQKHAVDELLDEPLQKVNFKPWKSSIAMGGALAFACTCGFTYSCFVWLGVMYHDLGATEEQAAGVLTVFSFMGIFASLLGPFFVLKVKRPYILFLLSIALYLIFIFGTAFAPLQGIWIWATALGVAPIGFPMLLTLINARARTVPGSTSLSGFMQSVGYLGGAIVPLIIGILHDKTGSWEGPLTVLGFCTIGVALGAWFVCQPKYYEDQARV